MKNNSQDIKRFWELFSLAEDEDPSTILNKVIPLCIFVEEKADEELTRLFKYEWTALLPKLKPFVFTKENEIINLSPPKLFWFELANCIYYDYAYQALTIMPSELADEFMYTEGKGYSQEEYAKLCMILIDRPDSSVYQMPLSYVETLYKM